MPVKKCTSFTRKKKRTVNRNLNGNVNRDENRNGNPYQLRPLYRNVYENVDRNGRQRPVMFWPVHAFRHIRFHTSVGPDYQVEIPDFIGSLSPDRRRDDGNNLLWRPNPDLIDDETINKYLIQTNIIGWNIELALYVLLKCSYDPQLAMETMQNHFSNYV